MSNNATGEKAGPLKAKLFMATGVFNARVLRIYLSDFDRGLE